MVDRAVIIEAIRRTAAANGGKPLGRERFAQETGIRQSDWLGRYWARWGDAVAEAGYTPNALQRQKLDDSELLAVIVAEVRRTGRIPTNAELRIRAREEVGFPSHNVFQRK